MSLIFPAVSVTVVVQSSYVVLSLKVAKVIVLLSTDAEVVVEEHAPAYVIVPASLEEKV